MRPCSHFASCLFLAGRGQNADERHLAQPVNLRVPDMELVTTLFVLTTTGAGETVALTPWTAPAERSGDGAFERTVRFTISTRLARAKAAWRCASRRSPMVRIFIDRH